MDKTNANYNQGMGNVKETAGNVTGNERLQGEGKAQNFTGKVEEMGARAQEYISEFAQKAKEDATAAYRSMTGHTDTNANSNTTGQSNR